MTQTLQPATSPSTPPPIVRKRRPGRKQLWGLGILAVATLGILGYMLSAYAPPNIATSRVPMNGNYLYYVVLVSHIGTGSIATIAGLLQFWPWLRRTRPKVHRWVGRAYFFAGVFPSMILLIPLAALSVGHGGASNTAGLFVMDALWIFTGISGYRTARSRQFADHRKWMIRNYAVTLVAIVTRAWTPVLAVVIDANAANYHGDILATIHDTASGSTWMALVVNLVAVEIYLQRRPKKARLAAAARAKAAAEVS